MLEGEMMNQRCETIRWMLGDFLLAVVLSLSSTGKAEALCASVKIEIQQDLTLERDGFDASMKIVNGFEGVALSNVSITVLFTDADGAAVTATTNPTNTSDRFFYRISSLSGINGTTVSLSGTFRDFKADITHADELGGQLTSFIDQTNVQTHMHVSDVLVDLNGRDTVRDFLGTNMIVYESQGIDSPVSDMSEFSSLTGGGTQYTLSISSATQGFIYVKETNVASESLVLKEVTRSDGKKINPANT